MSLRKERAKIGIVNILHEKHLSIEYVGFIDEKYSYILESKDTGATIHIHLGKEEHDLFNTYLEELKNGI